MTTKTITYLKDYTAPNYLVETIDLKFTINSYENVEVISRTKYYKNPKAPTFVNSLYLDGECQLNTVFKDDVILNTQEFEKNVAGITLHNLNDTFTLTITTTLNPLTNKTYMGLFESHGTLATQCEPEGFRHLTYYLDHPDVLALFTTTIIADQKQFPVLLSNGNKIEEKLLDNNKKLVKWADPFKKPCYLFALVAGDLGVFEGQYLTKSGRNVKLEIYTEHSNVPRCNHAMESLKRAMAWDEKRFNLEYDLDIYMIVASSNFNMGAMENKGLNIFNTKYILADIDTATDADFINVEAVIGHEYFHNWTGNRVTCRDWFQLSLKEGLTVYRDHEFTSDLHNRAVYRISNVAVLKRAQFTEDSGPLAHPIRPESYLEINNFYTTTIYEKGAEVVRMYQTILGNNGFTKGLTTYLQKNDGSAAMIEDFYQAMCVSNPEINLDGFMLWYSQAGTPKLSIQTEYDSATQKYSLHIAQSLDRTKGHAEGKPMLLPISIGLLDKNGQVLENITPVEGEFVKNEQGLVLLLRDATQTFIFEDISSKPIPSFLRGFSAPVILDYTYTEDELIFLANHDTDEYNRHQAIKLLMEHEIRAIYHNKVNKKEMASLSGEIIEIIRKTLLNNNLDPEFKGSAMQTPSFAEILVNMYEVDSELLADAIVHFQQELGEALFDVLIEVYNLNLTLKYDFADLGKRLLKNTALFYIIKSLGNKLNNPTSLQLIETLLLGQIHNADNMTDVMAVLNSVNDLTLDIRENLLNEFYQKWQNNELVIDKYFSLHALCANVSIEKLNRLLVDPAFIATNPNKIYSLIRAFTQNPYKFHCYSGYEFIADQVINIDKFNPHVASTVARGFNSVVYLNKSLQETALNALQRILKQANISNSTDEVVTQIANSLKI